MRPPSGVPTTIEVTFELARGGKVESRTTQVGAGTPLRRALRSAGLFGEGCTVLFEGRPVPLDTPLFSEGRWTVVPAFSGG